MIRENDDWIGRQRTVVDIIRPRDIATFHATFAGMIGPGAVPPGFHWCLAPDVALPRDLGRDGHPRLGVFLPPMPLPRRMWAGGALIHHAPLAEGEAITRRTTIAAITSKVGSSGPLWFLTLNHAWLVGEEIRIAERQDLVFREDPQADAPAPQHDPASPWPAAAHWRVTPDPTLLFRFSALTFNGHRIHYDHPYATGVEGYAGLVVHGPMQACWMLNLAAEQFGAIPRDFTYRGRAPLIAGEAVAVEARVTGSGLALRVRRLSDGVATMTAEATA